MVTHPEGLIGHYSSVYPSNNFGLWQECSSLGQLGQQSVGGGAQVLKEILESLEMTSGSTSLWGKTLPFRGRPCVWQLQPDVIPALKELSVCVLLRRSHDTDWTGFVYKGPGGQHIELGLGGTGTQLLVWLFGVESSLASELQIDEWYSVCLTWSGVKSSIKFQLWHMLKEKLEVNDTMVVLNLIMMEKVWSELHIETDTTSWASPNMTNCLPLVTISDLDNVTVTTDNAAEVVGMIQDLVNDQLGNNAELTSSDLDTVVKKLNQAVEISVVKPAVGTQIINIVADILLSKTDVTPVAGVVLNLTDMMGNKMDFPGESKSVTAPSVALSMINIVPDGFSGFTFSVSSTSSVQHPKLFRGDPKAFPSQLSDIVAPACPGSSPGSPPGGGMPGTPPSGGVQGASDTDARATSAGSSRCGGAAALLRAPPGQGLSSNPEGAGHLFPVENHGLGLGGADSHPNRFTLGCEPPQRMLKRDHHPSLPIQRHCSRLPCDAAETCQPRQPYNIQGLEILRADLIHPRCFATEELLYCLGDLSLDQSFCLHNRPGRGALGLPVPVGCLRSPTSQPGPIGLLLQLDSIPYFRCPPPGSGVAATTGTGDLATTALSGCFDNGGGEHGPLGLNVPSLPRELVEVLPEVFLNQSFMGEPLPGTDATISLPPAMHDFLQPGGSRVQFQFYATDDLFQDPRTANTTHSTLTLNSYVVSASVNNSHVNNLEDKVLVTFSQSNTHTGDKVQCVFWDFQRNGGRGGWNSTGCVIHSVSPHQTSCHCNHLTHFAVLLVSHSVPISDADSQILTVISYVGCGLSSIFLGITLLTYLTFDKKLRRDYPSKILINLSAALLGLSLVFLLDSWLSSFSNYGLCIVTAATLHYFLLASFTWMGLEAVHMYLALVKVFNTYIPSYILKFCAVGWGVPLFIVCLVLAIDKDAYGSALHKEAALTLQSTDQFCWLQDDVFFYVTVVAFVLLILLCNIAVFTVVLIQIRQTRANKPSANKRSSVHDLRAVASLTVLLGLTWSMGFFSFGPGRVVLLYLFSICNTLQGFFVFFFHCLMKENVRKQWRIHLCCGRLRLSDYSDWSRTVTAGGRRQNLINSDSVASDSTTTTTRVSDSSTG
ncbi:LOW QUALITY PROTEIN: uncharacterized protein LOC144739520 [Lampetra planeri]